MDAILLLLLVLGGPVVLAALIIRRVSKKEKRARAPITTPHNTASYGYRARPSHDTVQDQGPDLLTTAIVVNALSDDAPAEIRKHEPEPGPYEAPPSFKRHYEVDSSPSTTYDDSHSRSTSWDSGSSSSSSYDSGSSSSSSSSSWD